jgi:hypothetical protein
LIEKGISKFKVVRFGYLPRRHSPERTGDETFMELLILSIDTVIKEVISTRSYMCIKHPVEDPAGEQYGRGEFESIYGSKWGSLRRLAQYLSDCTIIADKDFSSVELIACTVNRIIQDMCDFLWIDGVKKAHLYSGGRKERNPLRIGFTSNSCMKRVAKSPV